MFCFLFFVFPFQKEKCSFIYFLSCLFLCKCTSDLFTCRGPYQPCVSCTRIFNRLIYIDSWEGCHEASHAMQSDAHDTAMQSGLTVWFLLRRSLKPSWHLQQHQDGWSWDIFCKHVSFSCVGATLVKCAPSLSEIVLVYQSENVAWRKSLEALYLFSCHPKVQ